MTRLPKATPQNRIDDDAPKQVDIVVFQSYDQGILVFSHPANPLFRPP